MADIKLDVVVSSKKNVSAFQMMFRGAGVTMQLDPNDNKKERGQITHPQGAQHYLEWSMLGEPGGSMKVEVLKQDGSTAKVRNASTIPNSVPVGYDRLKIDL